MTRQASEPKTLKQTSLSFPAKRPTVTEAKRKRPQPSAPATPAPPPTTGPSDGDGIIDIPDTPEVEDIESASTPDKDDEVELLSDDEPERASTSRRSRRTAPSTKRGKALVQEDEVEEDEEQAQPKKKRRVSARTAKSAAASIEAAAEDEDEGPPAKKGKGKQAKGKKSLAKSIFRSREGVENSESNKEADWATASQKIKITAKGNDKASVAKHVDVVKMREHFSYVRSQQGNVKPIHAENHSMEDHILRFFDVSYQYGPCIGVTRLQRWERAQALGLNPPEVIKQLLTNEDGTERAEVKDCVFLGEV